MSRKFVKLFNDKFVIKWNTCTSFKFQFFIKIFNDNHLFIHILPKIKNFKIFLSLIFIKLENVFAEVIK